MRTARIIYRYLTGLFLADVLLQFFLAGAGVFSAGQGRQPVIRARSTRTA